MINSSLNLFVHGFFHLSLGMSTIAIENHHQDQNGNDTDDEYVSKAVAMITDIEHSSLKVIL